VWHGGTDNEAGLLVSCYRSCFALAREHGLRTLAFPAISCGVYGYPVDQAVEIAMRETRMELESSDAIAEVEFVCFDDAVFASYMRAKQSVR
jgi:O-acetyl-ADP-ribose deacetylase (regulator of RNase III)